MILHLIWFINVEHTQEPELKHDMNIAGDALEGIMPAPSDSIKLISPAYSVNVTGVFTNGDLSGI